jgi:hypothetical protein
MPLPVIVTVPVGVGSDPVAGTVTVRVSVCPDTGAVGDRVKLIGPGAAFVITETEPLPVRKLLSPE